MTENFDGRNFIHTISMADTVPTDTKWQEEGLESYHSWNP